MNPHFIPYRTCDMRNRPGGYVQIHLIGVGAVWARLEKPGLKELDDDYKVILLGWGDMPGPRFCQLSTEDQEVLLTTLDKQLPARTSA